MIKLIHAADFHLDTPFGALPPEKATQRRGEQRDLLEKIATLTQEGGVDLVLLSGDLLDGEKTYYETAQALSRALGSIDAPVFIAPGNHDPYTAQSPYATLRWPANVHIFKTTAVEAVPLPQLDCVVYGSAFTQGLRDDDPLEGVAVPQDGRTHIMCVHGDVDGNGRYGSIDPNRIAQSGLHYLALGHVHGHTGIYHSGTTTWAYPGCPEGRGFDETGAKGILMGTVSPTETNMKFVPIAKRRYEILRVDVAEDFVASLPKTAQQDIYRILLTGESDAQGVDTKQLERLAQDYFYHVTLRDHTRVGQDLWSRREEDTLTGLFLREMWRQRQESQEESEQRQVDLAVRFGLAALEGREDPR